MVVHILLAWGWQTVEEQVSKLMTLVGHFAKPQRDKLPWIKA